MRLRVSAVLGFALGLGVWGGASAAENDAASSRWRAVCTLSGEDLSFANVHIESGGAARDAAHAHADRATVVIEVDGRHARIRAHVTAPLDAVLTTNSLAAASLSLHAGAQVGVVKALQDGAVPVLSVTGDGRAMTVRAGSLSISGLPLRCEDLTAAALASHWMFQGMSHRVAGLRRIYAAPDAGTGFSVDAPDLLDVSASDPPRNGWRQISYSADVGDKAGFSIDGWVRGVRLSPGGGMGGGAISDVGFRSCAPHTPARMGFATLPAGTALFESNSGDKVWTTLTAPVRALVALYPRDRAALAGLPGWTWPAARCATAWLDPDSLHLQTAPADVPGD